MFSPKYTITPSILSNIKKAALIVQELNGKSYPKPILYQMERTAREVSTYASVSIEGNPLPLTDVKQILKSKPENIHLSEQEVINYNHALSSLNKKLSGQPLEFNLKLLLSIHRQVMAQIAPEHQTGKLRQKPVFVNDPRKGKTVYWPPDAKNVEILLNKLVSFLTNNKGKMDPLVLAGLFHKQFVIIHPFMDGNGRTVRLATKALLADMGLNTFHLFSFENYYNRNVTNYFKNVGVLGNYYDISASINFTSWLTYFTEGVVDELLRVKKELKTLTLPTPENQLLPHHETIIAFIKEKGFINDRLYKKLTQRAKATRTLDFKKLINMKIIERRRKGKNIYYVLKDTP